MMEEMRPAFFKILHPRLNTTESLRIPPNFVKHIAKDENERALLKGPKGSHCYVKVGKTADGIFLQDGWQDFIRDHSLGDHEFVVLTYDRNMCFDVEVFDKNGCKKQYAVEELSVPSRGLQQHTRGRPRKYPLHPFFGQVHRQPTKFSIPALRKRGRPRKSDRSVIHHFRSEALHKDPGKESAAPERARTKNLGFDLQKASSHVGERLSTEDKKGALNSAKSFQSNFPFFKICLGEFNPKSFTSLILPRGFAMQYLRKDGEDVLLRVSDGGTWNARLSIRAHFRLVGGWKAFLADNNLKRGDACVLELVERNPIELRVSIFRSE